MGGAKLLDADLLHGARIEGLGGEWGVGVAGKEVRPVASRLLRPARPYFGHARLVERLRGDGACRPKLGEAAVRACGGGPFAHLFLQPGEAVVRVGGERTLALVGHETGELYGAREVRHGDCGLVAVAPCTVGSGLRRIDAGIKRGQDLGVLAHRGQDLKAVGPFHVGEAAFGEFCEGIVVRGFRVGAPLERLEGGGRDVPGILELVVAQRRRDG